MDRWERQRQLERELVGGAVDRLAERERRLAEQARPGGAHGVVADKRRTFTAPERRLGLRFLRETIVPLSRAIAEEQRAILNARGGPIQHRIPKLMLRHPIFAIITLRAVFTRIVESDAIEPPSVTEVSLAIGTACYAEWRRRRKRGGTLPNLHTLLRGRHKADDASTRTLKYAADNRTKAYIAEFERGAWAALDQQEQSAYFRLGGTLLSCATACGLVRRENEARDGNPARMIGRVYLTDDWAHRLEHARDTEAVRLIVRPWYLPMLVPPRPWKSPRGGGFLAPENPAFARLVKPNAHDPRGAMLKGADLREVYAAVNALQETPWRLNRQICGVLQYAWEAQLPLPGLPDQRRLTAIDRFFKAHEEMLADLVARRKALRARDKDLRQRKEAAEQALRGALNAQKRRLIPLDRHGACALPEIADALDRHDPTFRATWASLRAEWATYHRANASLWRHKRELRSLTSGVNQFERLLVACSLLEKERARNRHAFRLFFPYQLDYRGRAYSMVSTPSTQGNDAERAVLEFAISKPLGVEGTRWLAIHLANTGGQDKKSLSDRARWVEEHDLDIRALARMVDARGEPDRENIAALADPTHPSHERWADARTLWREAEDPWLFLAACFEWAKRDIPGFRSRLPITLDGTANGLQHLSALTLDPAGAAATNLLARETREDIYQRVADQVERIIAREAGGGDIMAMRWQGKITRKMVKRGVMTTPYGVTLEGMREQIKAYLEAAVTEITLGTETAAEIQARLQEAATRTRLYLESLEVQERLQEAASTDETPDPADLWPDAHYLAGHLREAIKTIAPRPIAVMAWLQEVTSAMWDATLGVTWTTPVGFPVVVAHPVVRSEDIGWKQASTLRKTKVRWVEPDGDGSGLDEHEQRKSVPPNFIHSLDAAHMMRSVRRLRQEGLWSFSVIHDSFGVHACDIPRMLIVLKEEFVALYEGDALLGTFLESQRTAAREQGRLTATLARELDRLRADDRTQRGTLNLQDIRESSYMFS